MWIAWRDSFQKEKIKATQKAADVHNMAYSSLLYSVTMTNTCNNFSKWPDTVILSNYILRCSLT